MHNNTEEAKSQEVGDALDKVNGTAFSFMSQVAALMDAFQAVLPALQHWQNGRGSLGPIGFMSAGSVVVIPSCCSYAKSWWLCLEVSHAVFVHVFH